MLDHVVVENLRQKEIAALKILSSEKMDLRELEILKAFQKRIQNQFKTIKLIAWGPGSTGSIDKSIEGYSWESLV